MRAWVLPLLLLLGACWGCRSAGEAETPAEVVRMFLDAMDRSSWDASALEDAYRLLAPSAREALEARARRAEALAGREMRPWDMLAQGRFRLRFSPRSGAAMAERIDGKRAVVIVRGRTEADRAEIPMVKERDRWRIQLDIPPIEGR